MATFIVTTTGSNPLTLAEALALAAANPGPDTIRFADDVTNIALSETLQISAEGGPVTIDGDINGDGVTNVTLWRSYDDGIEDRHLDIGEGAEVTLRNIDLFNGFDRPRVMLDGSEWLPAGTGEQGTQGALQPRIGLNGENAGPGGNGGNGDPGQHGPDAAGSIYNEGMLTLVRVGFGNNKAYGHFGQPGGSGGEGGASRGTHGLSDDNALDSPLPSIPSDRDQWQSIQNTSTSPQPGGKGGDGETGGRGGDGARGGDGGDGAGAIYNAAGATLTLQDVVFGGRMTSGLLAEGNTARGGFGGQGGWGGRGGNSWGGDGGNAGIEWSHVELASFDGGGPSRDYKAMFPFFAVAPAGAGGGTGNGGRGGDAGTNGDGGHAATVVNYGRAEGTVAAPVGADNPVAPQLDAGDSGPFGGRVAGGGPGGNVYPGEGGREGEPWHEAPLGLVYGSRTFETPGFSSFYARYEDAVLPGPTGYRGYLTNERADSGIAGSVGITGIGGQTGAPGREDAAVLNADTGVGLVDTANSLVYVHALGQDEDTGQLAFNIIRIGDTFAPSTVEWRLLGDGPAPLPADQFPGGALPEGSVIFPAMAPPESEEDALRPDTTNVQRVEIDLSGAVLGAGGNGYVFELLSATGDTVLGTAQAAGLTVEQTGGGDASLLLSLTFADPAGKALSGTEITYSPADAGAPVTLTSGATGAATLSLAPGSAGRLEAARDHGPGDPAITASDALEVLRMSVGLNPSFGPAMPEHYIAADINLDGRVEAADALEILRHAVGLPVQHAPEWLFIAADTDLSSITAQNTGVETGLAFDALAHAADLAMTGILLGSLVNHT